jgi:protein phosphatase
MKLVTASLTDVGRVRPNNEDAFGKFEPANEDEQRASGWLFLVADGMGGHQGGETASELAVNTVMRSYIADRNDDRAASLESAVQEANRVILQASSTDPSLMGMGTTCTAMAVRDGFAYFVHVGDSRAYVSRQGEMIQLTQDHSLVGEMVRSGILSDEDARVHPKRNVITRSLGIQETVEVDTPFSPFKLERGDVFLICSDGLTSLVPDEEISAVLDENSPQDACRRLVDKANQNGGRDNVTVLVIKVEAL